jgi:hypothetical protein
MQLSCRPKRQLESLAEFSAEYGESRTQFKSQQPAPIQNLVEFPDGKRLSSFRDRDSVEDGAVRMMEEFQPQGGARNARRKMPQGHLSRNVADIGKLWLNRAYSLEIA